MKKENRRKCAASRSKPRNGFSRAMILRGKKQHCIRVLDYDFGGIGIDVPDNAHRQLGLVVGRPIVIQFFLGGVQHNDVFTIQSINGNRVGLMYVNKKYMTPQRRLFASQNNIGR